MISFIGALFMIGPWLALFMSVYKRDGLQDAFTTMLVFAAMAAVSIVGWLMMTDQLTIAIGIT